MSSAAPGHAPPRGGPSPRRGAALVALLLTSTVAESAAQLPDSLRLTVSDTVPVPDTVEAEAARAPLPREVVAHLEHVGSAFPDTPGGMGLLGTGMAEARIAADAVRAAARDSTSIGGMRRGMADMLHAIDPVEVGGGRGLGYGFKRAVEGVRAHAELAAAGEGASEIVLFHLPYVTRAASGALLRADEAIAMARRIQAANTAAEARPLVRRLARLLRAMTYGDDSDGDGRIGYSEAESGLAQAGYHLELVYRVEGLLGR